MFDIHQTLGVGRIGPVPLICSIP